MSADEVSGEVIQVAGHGDIRFDNSLPKEDAGSRLVKPTNEEEAEFYRALESDPRLTTLKSFIPK